MSHTQTQPSMIIISRNHPDAATKLGNPEVVGRTPRSLRGNRWQTDLIGGSRYHLRLRPRFYALLLLLSCIGVGMFASGNLHAGGWGIRHKTEKRAIIKILEKPNATPAEIDAERETRLTVGIGEVIELWIDGENSVMEDAAETVWEIEETDGNADAEFTASNANNNSNSSTQPGTSNMPASEGTASTNSTFTGAAVALKIKVTDVNNEIAFVTVKATIKDGRSLAITFGVVRPEYWLCQNKGQNETFLADSSTEWKNERRLEISTPAHWWLCEPNNVNFENVYFREIDLGSPLDLLPLPSAEEIWGDFIHNSGESNGDAIKIKYFPGNYGSIPDHLGGVFLDRRRRINGVPTAIGFTSEQVKEYLDNYGTHSFNFKCGFYLYEDNDAQRDKVWYPIATMVPCRQRFKFGKIQGGYYSEIRKLGAVTKKTIYDNHYISYLSLMTNGWTADLEEQLNPTNP